jgi:hypothetical protein
LHRSDAHLEKGLSTSREPQPADRVAIMLLVFAAFQTYWNLMGPESEHL